MITELAVDGNRASTIEQVASAPFRLARRQVIVIALISAVYFADIFLKASHKCYWYDELFTVYLCRLPGLGDIWQAVLHGADFNPPLFYLMTRGAQQLFGHGLIATRLPSTIGVWLFGVSLFLFTGRRTGWMCGLIAGVFPFVTVAQYYAYEARAHGAMLGWCGVALLSWQRHRECESKYSYLWLAGFGLSLAGALLTHVYGIYLFVPFAAVEFYHVFKRVRPDWQVLCAMLCSAVPVIFLVYLPLFHSYRATVPSGFLVPNHGALQEFLVTLFGPALGVLLLVLLLFGLEAVWPGRALREAHRFLPAELLLATAFLFLPLLGFAGSKVSHGPFVGRYFLSSIAGLAIFLASALAVRPSGARTARLLATCLVLCMMGDLVLTIYLVANGRSPMLVEPSSKMVLSTTPSDPMQAYQAVASDPGGLDILVLPSLDYFYFFEYAPQSIVRRLYFATASDVGLELYQKLAVWVHIAFQTTSFEHFLTTHERFLVYVGKDGADGDGVREIARHQYRLVAAYQDAGGILYEFAK